MLWGTGRLGGLLPLGMGLCNKQFRVVPSKGQAWPELRSMDQMASNFSSSGHPDLAQLAPAGLAVTRNRGFLGQVPQHWLWLTRIPSHPAGYFFLLLHSLKSRKDETLTNLALFFFFIFHLPDAEFYFGYWSHDQRATEAN